MIIDLWYDVDYPKLFVLGACSITKHSESTYHLTRTPLSDRCGSPLPPPHAPPPSLTHHLRGCAPTHQCCVSVYPDSGCRLPPLHSWAEIPLDSHLSLRFPSQHPHTHTPTHPYPATLDQCLPGALHHTPCTASAPAYSRTSVGLVYTALCTTPHHTHTHSSLSPPPLCVCVCVCELS
jgi:hypothetical protein